MPLTPNVYRRPFDNRGVDLAGISVDFQGLSNNGTVAGRGNQGCPRMQDPGWFPVLPYWVGMFTGAPAIQAALTWMVATFVAISASEGTRKFSW